MAAVTDIVDTLDPIISYLDTYRNLKLRVALDSNMSLADPNIRLYKFGLIDFTAVPMSNAFTDEKFILKNNELFPYHSYRITTEYLHDLIENILTETGYSQKDISAEHFLYILTVELKNEYIMMEIMEEMLEE